MSRLHLKKGLNYLIPALGKLKNYRFTFIIAGSGPVEYQLEINRLLKEAGIDGCTYLSGLVEGEIKEMFLQGADVFVLTSFSENFGIVVLEAMAFGIPVIVTGGVALSSEVKKYEAGYVCQLDIDDISRSIQHILDDPKSAEQMGKNGFNFASTRCVWPSIAQRLKEKYTEILSHE